MAANLFDVLFEKYIGSIPTKYFFLHMNLIMYGDTEKDLNNTLKLFPIIFLGTVFIYVSPPYLPNSV